MKVRNEDFFILSGFAFFLKSGSWETELCRLIYGRPAASLLNHQFSDPLGLFLSLSTVHQVPYPEVYTVQLSH